MDNEIYETITPPPYLISYSITRKCNLKCKHCYSDATEDSAPDELSTADAKRLLEDIVNWGIKLLIFDGGEPLYRNDFWDIGRYASLKGLRVVIGSNGTLINSEVAERLKSSGTRAVQISIDGAKARTHDLFRREGDSFNKALEGAKACKAVELPFQFGMTIRRGTLDEIPDMLKLAVNSGVTAAEFFDLVQVPRVKKEIPEEVLAPDERKEVMEWLAKAQKDCPIIIRVPGCPMYTIHTAAGERCATQTFPSKFTEKNPVLRERMCSRNAQWLSYNPSQR